MNTPEHIEGCHSCGIAAHLTEVDGFTHIECINPQCDLAIHVEHRLRAVAIERWNRRSNSKQIQTLKCFLWAVIAQNGGEQTVSDALLSRAMTPEAALNITARDNETLLRSMLEVLADGPPPEEDGPKLITPEQRLYRGGRDGN